VLLSSGDSFPHLIQKRRSQLGFVTYLLNRPRTKLKTATKNKFNSKSSQFHDVDGNKTSRFSPTLCKSTAFFVEMDGTGFSKGTLHHGVMFKQGYRTAILQH
jgi:hypothetical protein